MKDITTTATNWETIKASHSKACQAREDAIRAFNAAEAAWMDYRETAPAATIAYTVEGFSQGPVQLESYQQTVTVTHDNADRYEKELGGNASFAAYRATLDKWREAGRDLHTAYGNADQSFADASDMVFAVIGEAIAFPVATFAQLREKIALATAEHLDEDEQRKLIAAIDADLERLTGAQ